MKTQNSNDNNKRSFGKIAALVLVLAFITINHYRSEKDIIPKNAISSNKEASKLKQNLRNQFSNRIEAKHIERLKYAYTGKWAKNEVKDSQSDGGYSFSAPAGTRNLITPTSKKIDKNKKKKVAAKTKTKAKVAKKSKKGLFHNNYENYKNDDLGATNSPYPANPYYTQPNPQDRTPSEDENEKKLSAQEWVELITKSNSVSELVAAYGKIGQNLFYSVVESLLSSPSEGSKKLGFQALSQVPSAMSFMKTAQHLNDDMSTAMKTYAQGTLQVYEKPDQVRVLNAVLNSKDAVVKILAATIIRNVTSSIVQAQASSGENVVYTEAQLKLYNTLLTQSLNVINTALEAGVEATVAASFTSARTILVEFLS